MNESVIAAYILIFLEMQGNLTGLLTCNGGAKVLPQAPVVSQPVTRVQPLSGERGPGDDERPLSQNLLQSAE